MTVSAQPFRDFRLVGGLDPKKGLIHRIGEGYTTQQSEKRAKCEYE
jgi:hypothetical protein